jgi:hypothetical protein
MSFDDRSGLFVVRYASAEELAPERQAALVGALREAAARGPVAVVFVVAPSIQLVGHDVPGHWVTISTDPSFRLCAMAVVTPKPAVSVATRAFGTANLLRGTGVAVKPFAEEVEALAWAGGELTAARRKAAAPA